ncbi:MAG: hypothetical protein KDC54_18910, partial [Lewinella sp.]|nr:hypothetical protein [Lewinella sp.]
VANTDLMTDEPVDDLSGLNACGTGQIIRTWSVTDCSDNVTSVSQVISIVDNDPPAITGNVPGPVTVACDAVPPPAPLVATDDCDASLNSTGMPVDDGSGLGACGTGTLVRTWTATDCAGNATSVTQLIQIVDNDDPSITGNVPSDVTVACTSLPPAAPLAAMDNCDASISSTGLPVDDTSGLGPCGTGTITRTWTVTDCSGNSTSVSQLITLVDDTPPNIDQNPQAEIWVECFDLPPGTPLAASDACDPSVFATDFPVDEFNPLDNCGQMDVIRTWTVTDCSGNSADYVQVIHLEDIFPPQINEALPQDMSVSCGELPPAAALAASDGCDGTVTTTGLPVDDVSALNACGLGPVFRTWTVSDCVGNTFSHTQTIFLTDDQGPTIDGLVPPTLVLSCGDPLPPADPLAASDACDVAVITTGLPMDDTSGLGSCGVGEVIRSWSVSDCAGNTTTVSQTIQLVDDLAPQITDAVPADMTLSCGDPLPAAAPLAATDLCDPNVTQTGAATDDTSNLAPCGTGAIVRTWTATDCAGNSTSASQLITIVDDTPPVLIVPADTTVSCGALPPEDPAAALATDNCSTATVTYLGQDTIGSGCQLEIHRTWEAIDACGLSVTAMQVILVQDTLAPVFLNTPAHVTVCPGSVPPLADLSWNDNCDGGGTTSPVETLQGTLDDGQITRTWTQADACGNVATYTQVITIQADATVQAGADQTICSGTLAQLAGTAASSQVDWMTLGDGLFATPASTTTTYSPGAADLVAGMVQLVFSAEPGPGGCGGGSDTLLLQLIAPSSDAGPGATLTCDLTAVNLGGPATSVGPGITYQWSGPGLTTAQDTLAQPLVSVAGAYQLVVRQSVGNAVCTDTSLVMVSADQAPPLADAGPDQTLDCSQTNTILDASGSTGTGALTYHWSGPGMAPPADTLIMPMVSQAGTFVLTVENTGNGCVAMDTVLVNQSSELPTADAGPDQVLSCAVTAVLLDGSQSAQGSNITYSWLDESGAPLGNSDTLLVDLPGLYTLQVTDQDNGCSGTGQVNVTRDTLPPPALAGPDTVLTCLQPSLLLAGNLPAVGQSVSWSRDGQVLSTQPELLVETVGSYVYTVLNEINGCVGRDSLSVTEDISLPAAAAGPDQTLTCAQTTAVLDGSNSSTGTDIVYQWAGPNTMSDQLSVTINEPGSYILAVLDMGNGCSSSDTVQVLVDQVPPVAQAGADVTLTCAVTSLTLDGSASSPVGSLVFAWEDPAGMDTLSLNPVWTVMAPGDYLLRVRNTLNGCLATDTITVAVDTLSPVALAGPDATLNCLSPTIELDGSA